MNCVSTSISKNSPPVRFDPDFLHSWLVTRMTSYLDGSQLAVGLAS